MLYGLLQISSRMQSALVFKMSIFQEAKAKKAKVKM